MSTDGLCTKWHRNIAENFKRLSTNRQTAGGRATAYSEREREFTFTKNRLVQKNRSGSMKAVLPRSETTGKDL